MKSKGRPQKIYTQEEKDEIKKAYKNNHNPKDRGRLLCIKLRVVNGLSVEEISKITEYSLSTVSHVISLYNRFGIEEVAIKKYKGNHRNMTPEEEKAFLEPFRKKALAGEILEVSEIITAYENKLNKKVSKSTVYDLLHRNEWRKVMPRSEHPNKASEEAIEAYKKNVWQNI
ncbi:winged helix-turn-helix domain-containing protein [Clostridium sp.]|uniref:helix-turn-helix domain-containing protein n=1 Tax=Clostridium sp. TaxID=1506 RepID=UPI00261CE84F|nr:winged helix-turn-helix domain-containing protein [Clostridium sp.]